MTELNKASFATTQGFDLSLFILGTL